MVYELAGRRDGVRRNGVVGTGLLLLPVLACVRSGTSLAVTPGFGGEIETTTVSLWASTYASTVSAAGRDGNADSGVGRVEALGDACTERRPGPCSDTSRGTTLMRPPSSAHADDAAISTAIVPFADS